MEYELMIGKDRAVSLVQDNSIGKLIKPLSREIQLFDSYVAGNGYGDAEALVALKVDDKLLLKREPDNRFDDNAIAVLDAQNRKIGYIPERDGTVAARLMDAGKYLTAKVIRLEEKGSFRQVNISIELVDF